MNKQMQPARLRQLFRRAVGLAASVLLVLLHSLVSPVVAQEGGDRAGLIIQFGDGSVYTACVDLGADGEATGEELLRDAGFVALIDYSSGFGGGTVCKIGNEGCSFPAEACFCQCTMKPGEPCIYWTYFFQQDGQWRYSNRGASIFIVKPGDVQGWVWGLGGAGAGILPPLITFEQICSAPAQATSPPSASESALPTVSPTVPPATPTPLPTDTPSPSATPLPTETPLPTDTPLSTTPTLPPEPLPSASSTIPPSFTPSASPTLEPTASATPTHTPEATAFKVENNATGSLPTPSVQETEDAEPLTNYMVFGVLVVVLLGGLIFMRAR